MNRCTHLVLSLAFLLVIGCSSSDGASETGEETSSEDAAETAADAETGETGIEDAKASETAGDAEETGEEADATGEESGEEVDATAESGEEIDATEETGEEADASGDEAGAEVDASGEETGAEIDASGEASGEETGEEVDATGEETGETEIPEIPEAEGCQLELRTRINGTVFWQANEGDNVELQAHVKNLTDVPLPLTVVDACPNGVAAFQGLPEGYDYYGSCNAGACPPDLPPKVIIIEAGQTQIIETAAINLSGGTCNEPVPPALAYEINYALTTFQHANPNLCNGASFSASLTVCEGVCPD